MKFLFCVVYTVMTKVKFNLLRYMVDKQTGHMPDVWSWGHEILNMYFQIIEHHVDEAWLHVLDVQRFILYLPNNVIASCIRYFFWLFSESLLEDIFYDLGLLLLFVGLHRLMSYTRYKNKVDLMPVSGPVYVIISSLTLLVSTISYHILQVSSFFIEYVRAVYLLTSI